MADNQGIERCKHKRLQHSLGLDYMDTYTCRDCKQTFNAAQVEDMKHIPIPGLRESFAETLAPKSILDEAKSLVYGERNAAYGHPRDNLKMIAEMWNSYLDEPPAIPTVDPPCNRKISPRNVAMMMVLVKVAREAQGPKRDNLTDIASYAATAERLDEPV